jgi:hypothetical protein
LNICAIGGEEGVPVTIASMDEERGGRLDEAFSEFVARVMCLRPVLYVKSGDVLSLVANDPLTPDKRISTCQSCNGAMRGLDRGRMLCSTCRATPRVLEGAPLITTMYRSANCKYDLNAETEALVAQIGQQRNIASASQIVSKNLAYLSYNVHERWKRRKGNLNVHFTPESVRDCSYARQVTHCNPKYADRNFASDEKVGGAHPRHVAVTVGGLGPKLKDVVKQSVVEWLYNLDAMIRAQFEITLATRPNDTSVVSAVDQFATLIANKVVLMEDPRADPAEHLCTRVFEQIAKIQFVTCENNAARLAGADIRAMRELAALARDETVPENSLSLTEFLYSPCPELIKALPTVAMDMRFAALRAILLCPEQCATRLSDWRASVATGALCLLLGGAIESTQKWRPVFLACLRRDDVPSKLHLPAQGWVDNAQCAHWSLVSRATHAQRRSGLDHTGLRIVLMSAALVQINGAGDFFVPGVVRCDIMHQVCTRHEYVSTYAYHALSEQLWPYMTGAPWRFARSEVVNWQGSHMEDDVRRAAVTLGGFTLDEITQRFAGSGVVRGSSSSSSSSLAVVKNIVRMTTDKMVYKPEERYEGWFPVSIDLLMPILAQLRQSAGLARNVVSNPLADVLRLLRPVREWQPSHGTLEITAGEAYRVPHVKSTLLKLRAENSPLLKYKRKKNGTVMCWVFDPKALVRVLHE